MYVGLAFLVAGIGIALASDWTLVMLVAAALLIHFGVVKREELLPRSEIRRRVPALQVTGAALRLAAVASQIIIENNLYWLFRARTHKSNFRSLMTHFGHRGLTHV